MRPTFPKHLAALFLLVLSLPACGIVFSAQFPGTEVFRGFKVEGDFVAGEPLTVTLVVNQAYPVPLAISCRYENVDITDDQRKVAFDERTQSVFATVLDANPGYDPGEDEAVVDRLFQFEFSVPEPGDYFIACFTVAAPENGVGRGFTIEAPDSNETPTPAGL